MKKYGRTTLLAKKHYLFSVKLRHHLGVDAANRWWDNKNGTNGDSYDRKRPLDAGCRNLLSNWFSNYTVLRKQKVM